MRYEDHGAFKVLQGVHQHRLGGKIQGIRRFVEHQEVRRVIEHACYCQPRLFSARECADLLIHVFAGEPECSRQGPQRPKTVLGMSCSTNSPPNRLVNGPEGNKKR